MRPTEQAILYSSDPSWINRVTAYSQPYVQLHMTHQESELERLLNMLSPTLLILDIRTKGARALPSILHRRWPDTLILACGKDRSDPIREARMAGVYGTMDFDISAQAFKDLLGHSLDYLKALRLLHQQPHPQQTAPLQPNDNQPGATISLMSLLQPFPASCAQHTTTELILERYSLATGAHRLGLFLMDTAKKEYRLCADRNACEHTRQTGYPPDHALPQWLHLHAQIIQHDRPSQQNNPTDTVTGQQALDQMKAELILPLIHDSRLSGWIFCSGAADGHPYTKEERHAFLILAQQAAGALAAAAQPVPPPEPETIPEELRQETPPPPNPAPDKKQDEDDELWSDLATSMAHEIRNPLVAIKTFSQLLPERYEDADFRGEFSRLVSDEVARLNHTVEEINGFAHPPELIFQNVPLTRILENAMAWTKRDTGKKHLPIHITPPDAAITLQGDERALSESLSFLMINAVEATQKQENPTINISILQPTDYEILIIIADNGKGVTEKLQHKLFSPFCTTKARGLGLGLPVARRTILRHGGELTIDPSPEGTLVTVSLPIEPAEHPAYETSVNR